MKKKPQRYLAKKKLARLVRNENFKRDFINENGGCCSVCGYSKCANALVFHHVNPKTKKFALSKIHRKIREYGKKAVLKEIEKCELVCHNCHSEIHYEECRNNLRRLITEES